MSGDLERVQAHIDEALKHFRHLQQLVARPSQANAIPAERSVPSTASVPATEPPLEQALGAGGEATVPSEDEAAVPSAATSDVEQAQDIRVMLSPEGQLADLQGHFNALLQVLSRRCVNNRD
jgi:hypothetical protein